MLLGLMYQKLISLGTIIDDSYDEKFFIAPNNLQGDIMKIFNLLSNDH